MQIARTRFVRLPRRITPAARAHAGGEKGRERSAFMVKYANAARPAVQARPQTPGVLWREVPEWHNLAGDPARVLDEGRRAYGRALGLRRPAATGRLADARA